VTAWGQGQISVTTDKVAEEEVGGGGEGEG
jgi:hypothetical protein